MNLFTALFLAALAGSTLLQLWLSNRQRAHVRAHRGAVPGEFAERIALDEHHKAADYTVTKTGLGMLELLYGSLLLLAWTLGGGLEWLDSNWRSAGLGSLATGIGFMLSAMIIMSLLDLPFSLYHTFVIEERFGFNKTTAKTFVLDLVKGLLLSILIGGPLLAGLLFFSAILVILAFKKLKKFAE